MAKRRRLRLNSLNRFSKQSDRLILDSYSAGCGGIILRWRDPTGGTPVAFVIACNWETKLFLDGNPISRRIQIAPGEHVLGIRCRPIPQPAEEDRHEYYTPPEDLIALGLQLDYPEPGSDFVPDFWSNTTWRHEAIQRDNDATEPEKPQWAEPDFSDFHWSPMERGRIVHERNKYLFNYLSDAGAAILKLPTTDEVRIRYRFQWERKQ